MEEAYGNLNAAYLQIKGMVVIEGFYALVAGFVITTFVFKLVGIIKEMIKTVLAYGADELMKSLANGGVYNPHNIWKDPISAMLDELMNGDITDIAVNGLDTLKWSLISGTVGSLFGVAYDYIMLLFLCTRYLILLLLEIISPIAIACLYNKDTRSSFYTWVKQMLGCYMLYPGFILASVFSDLIVTNYVLQRSWSVLLMVIFSFLLKLTMLGTVKATVNKWL